MIQCSEKGSDQDKMQSCALNAGDNLCADSMKDFFEIGCNIMDNMAHKFTPPISIYESCEKNMKKIKKVLAFLKILLYN